MIKKTDCRGWDEYYTIMYPIVSRKLLKKFLENPKLIYYYWKSVGGMKLKGWSGQKAHLSRQKCKNEELREI